MSKQTININPNAMVQIRTSTLDRDLLEQAFRQIEVNKAAAMALKAEKRGKPAS